MNGILGLEELLMNINPVLSDKQFIFAVFKNKNMDEITALNPLAVFKEDEGTTVVVEKETADENKILYKSTFRKITLQVFSSLEAIGLTASVSKALSDKNIPANIVAAYYHDHIFVPAVRADEALAIIKSLRE